MAEQADTHTQVDRLMMNGWLKGWMHGWMDGWLYDFLDE